MINVILFFEVLLLLFHTKARLNGTVEHIMFRAKDLETGTCNEMIIGSTLCLFHTEKG